MRRPKLKLRASPLITVTTFVVVPWNAPYHERCGFRVLAGADLTPGQSAIRQAEDELWHGRWPRVAMRRDIVKRDPPSSRRRGWGT